jgi:hypothetical protein
MFEKLESFMKKVSDLADRPTINPKTQFDAAPDELRQYFNKLIDSLKLTTDGDSGAKNIGASAISGVEGTDIQSILISLKGLLDKKIAGNGQTILSGVNSLGAPSPGAWMVHVEFPTPFTNSANVVANPISSEVLGVGMHSVSNITAKGFDFYINIPNGYGYSSVPFSWIAIGK